MTRISLSQAREGLPDLVNRAAYGGERMILARRGKPVAAIIPIADLRLLERLAQAEEDRQDIEAARLAKAEAETSGYIPLREVLRENETEG